MDIQHLESVEAIYGVQLPEVYLRLCQDGLLETGKYGSMWYGTYYVERLKHPTLLFLSNEFELIEDNSIAEVAEWVNDDFSPEEFTCIPFAMSGAGDYYCVAYPKEDNDGIDPVVIYLPHDYNEYTYLAKNFVDFIFRHFLEALTDLSFFDLEDEKFSIKKALHQSLLAHQPYLSEEQFEKLKDILTREIQTFEDVHVLPKRTIVDEYVGYLSKEEFKSIIESMIPFEFLDQEVSF